METPPIQKWMSGVGDGGEQWLNTVEGLRRP